MLLGAPLPLALLLALDVAAAPTGDFLFAVVFAVAKPPVAFVFVLVAVVSFFFGLGLLYAKSGQRGKVLAAYKRLKSLDSALAEQLFNLAVMP